ncbi:hypothetical protein KM043_000744 [Ampulex compressa]|nr:hypothetical protein KM043_000744 [Ampulex compressa]
MLSFHLSPSVAFAKQIPDDASKIEPRFCDCRIRERCIAISAILEGRSGESRRKGRGKIVIRPSGPTRPRPSVGPDGLRGAFTSTLKSTDRPRKGEPGGPDGEVLPARCRSVRLGT